MKRTLAVACSGVLFAALSFSGAAADTDHSVELLKGESATVEGDLPGGVNHNYFALVGPVGATVPQSTPQQCAQGTCVPSQAVPSAVREPAQQAVNTVTGAVNPIVAPPEGTCTHDLTTYCETTLVKVTNPVEDDGNPETDLTAKRSLTVTLTPAHPAADFDLVVYESDEDGTQGENVGESGGAPVADHEESVEETFVSVTTSESTPSRYYLVHAVYFAAPSTYTLSLQF